MKSMQYAMNIDILILIALLFIATLLRLLQARRQHRQLIELIDALAEMIGEWMDKEER